MFSVCTGSVVSLLTMSPVKSLTEDKGELFSYKQMACHKPLISDKCAEDPFHTKVATDLKNMRSPIMWFISFILHEINQLLKIVCP